MVADHYNPNTEEGQGRRIENLVLPKQLSEALLQNLKKN